MSFVRRSFLRWKDRSGRFHDAGGHDGTAADRVRCISTPVPTAVAVLVLVAVGGCTTKPVPPPPGPSTPTAARTSSAPAPRTSDLTISLDAAGLSPAGKAALSRVVGSVVGRWLEAAYLSGPAGTNPGAERFPGFTGGAARSAARHPGELTNAALGAKARGLVATTRTVKATAYVSGHRAQGVVAAVAMAAASPRGKLTVRGSVYLTPADGTWRIFGYHLRTATP
jgi:hypothetical protein